MIWHDIFIVLGVTYFRILRLINMDIYQFATAYWDQVYEEQETKKSPKQKKHNYKIDKQYTVNSKGKVRFLNFPTIE
ncbi:hypothetical protein CLV98_1242 [Dyadobacter jejuensis]|uniref:Uncharacterized protein n=1 Tax=Dyadobacter jejuensis TaxID=1082580 RepID=A0A316A624_9BACT|nr:hypothetical protein CLV98_1242 [Dyadobacter jejuensis]